MTGFMGMVDAVISDSWSGFSGWVGLGLNEVWVIILLRGTGLTRRGWWLLVGFCLWCGFGCNL